MRKFRTLAVAVTLGLLLTFSGCSQASESSNTVDDIVSSVFEDETTAEVTTEEPTTEIYTNLNTLSLQTLFRSGAQAVFQLAGSLPSALVVVKGEDQRLRGLFFREALEQQAHV